MRKRVSWNHCYSGIVLYFTEVYVNINYIILYLSVKNMPTINLFFMSFLLNISLHFIIFILLFFSTKFFKYDILLKVFGIYLQVGLVDLLISLGINPDYIISHSGGELGCAYADGCLTIEQTILSAYFIGLACTEGKIIRNSMAIVSISYDYLKNICPTDIQIVCRNSENNSVVSGPIESVQEFMKKLQVDLKIGFIFSK